MTMREEYRAHKAQKQATRDWRRDRNWSVLNACRIPFELRNDGEAVLFRQPGKPAADFYPSTGRWRSGERTYTGGAHAFLDWYRRAVEPRPCLR